MNLLYVLGPLSLSTWHNNEIRYSLRSVDSAEVSWIGIAGPEMPPFLTGVQHIKIDPQDENRYRRTQRQILAACQDERVPEELILMNDDFMVQSPQAWSYLPTHRQPVQKRQTPNLWKKTIIDTAAWLETRGIPQSLCYEGHTPFPFDKINALTLIPELLAAKDILQFRTAYGNVNHIGGKLSLNAKRELPRWPEGPPFWSLKGTPSDKAKKFLEGWLTTPSRWEA